MHIPPACIANWSTRKLPALNVMATVAVASVFCIVPYMVVGTYTHIYSHCRQTNMFITPRAHARSGVKQSVLSVSLSVCQSVSLSVCQSVTRKKLKSRHIDPHKPSKWSQTIANSKKKLLYVYLTEVKSLRFAVFRLYPTFHNYS